MMKAMGMPVTITGRKAPLTLKDLDDLVIKKFDRRYFRLDKKSFAGISKKLEKMQRKKPWAFIHVCDNKTTERGLRNFFYRGKIFILDMHLYTGTI